MKWWKHLGTSSGTTLLKPLSNEWNYWREWLKVNYTGLYESRMETSSPKQRMLGDVYRLLGIGQKDYFHNHKRGVFFCPLYTNYREFLTDKINIKSLEPVKMDCPDWWIRKSDQRWKKLEQENRLETEPLFHQSMNESDLENWLSSRGGLI